MSEQLNGNPARSKPARRVMVSSILCFGQTAAAMVWLQAAGPIGWIFAYCFAAEALFFLRLLLAEHRIATRAGARKLLDRLTKIGLAALFLFGAAAIIIGLDITPASAYLAWFQLVQEGAGGGTLAYMFAVKYAYFAALFGGFIMVGSGLTAVLNLFAVDLLISAVILGKPAFAVLGFLLFLIALGRHVIARNPKLKNRAVLATIQVSVVAFIVALPLSVFHFRNLLIDDLFDVSMQGFVAGIIPNFPFLYNVPGYGYTLESSKIGDRPALTSRPVFDITAPAGSTVYIRTGVYDTYTGEGWELSRSARATAERGVQNFESTSTESSFVPTDRVTFKVLIDFYSSLPHTLGTVAFRFPGEHLPQIGLASLGSGFVLDAPLRRGSEIVDLIARPGDTTPRPVIVGYGGVVFPSRPDLPPPNFEYYFDGLSFGGQVRNFGHHFGIVQQGSSQASNSRPIAPKLTPKRGTYLEHRAYREKAAAAGGKGPLPPQESGNGHKARTEEPRVGYPYGPFAGDDGDPDDALWSTPNVRRSSTPSAPNVQSDGRFRYDAFHQSLSQVPGLEVPPPKFGLQYGRYVLTPRERRADLETGDVSDRLRELAKRLGAGKSQAATLRAIRSYLVDNYKYSLLTSTAGPYHDAVSNFLFSSKTGFCVQFASAFVLLARLNNIPARYVTGFLANLPTGADHMTVTGLSAHSWAETWSNRLGWLTQEATPPMIAAAAGDPNVLQQFNPGDSGFTQRQLVALLGGRLPKTTPTPGSSSARLSTDLSKMATPLLGMPSRIAASVVLLALLLLLLRFSYFRLAPVEIRFRRVVRQIARRSKARGLPDPARRGWREWSYGVVEHNPARRPVAHRAAIIIHRSFFAGNANGYRLLRRDVVFLRGLYRRLLTRRKSSAPSPRSGAPVS